MSDSGRFYITDFIQKMHFVSDAAMTPIEKARHCGTLDKPDRSKQYPLDTQKQIVDAVNLALTKVRQVEKAKDEEIEALKKRLDRYHFVNIVLTSIITGLAWEGLKALTALLWH